VAAEELDDYTKAMLWQRPDFIPTRISLLPSTWIQHREKLDPIVDRHSVLFDSQPQHRDYDRVMLPTYAEGEHVDAWGCVWSNIKRGREAIVTGHPLPDRRDVQSFRAPEVDTGLPHGLMYLRLADLRGFEELMLDFAEEPPELQMLIDIVLEYNLRQVDILLSTRQKQTLIYFGDDLGMQDSLPIRPESWRKYLKPCFAELFGRCRRAGHWVYLHTDGHVLEIIPDLIECGANVLNLQIGANRLERLVEACKGQVCVDLDLDRQKFPFWGAQEIDAHVHEVVDQLGSPEGGLWLTAEIADDVPLENIEAIATTLEKYRSYFR
jgi:hypothetical protein